MQRRLALALESLRGRMPLAEVARRCGFADHAHLTRSFRARFGVPPSAAIGASA
jgi:AraC family transcriptional regulator